MSIPSIVKIAEVKHIFDEPDPRKLHSSKTPTLGGLAIFASIIFTISFWIAPEDFYLMKYVLSSIIIIFFTGIKDDIVNLVAWKKLFAQTAASFIATYWGNIRLSSLYGVLGFYEIPFEASLLLSLITYLAIINSFNLIDGVNLLAASIGILVTTILGIWFYLVDLQSFSLMAFSMSGALLAFSYYNKTPAKIFMGDTGSLLLGLIVSILIIHFIEFNRVTNDHQYSVKAVPVVAIGLLIIPLFDLLQVSIKRIMQKRSPFSADREHLHHKLLDLGLGHNQTVFILISFNIMIILFTYFFQHIQAEILLIYILCICLLATNVLFYVHNKKFNKQENSVLKTAVDR